MGKVYPIKHATKMSIYREALQKSWNPTARPPYGREGSSRNCSHRRNDQFRKCEVLFATHSASVWQKIEISLYKKSENIIVKP